MNPYTMIGMCATSKSKNSKADARFKIYFFYLER